jgi:hypothetical protein
MNGALFAAAIGGGYLIARTIIAVFRVKVPTSVTLDAVCALCDETPTPPILLRTVCCRCGADLGDVQTMNESVVELLIHELLSCQKVTR